MNSLKEACIDSAKASPESGKAESLIEKLKRQDPKLRKAVSVNMGMRQKSLDAFLSTIQKKLPEPQNTQQDTQTPDKEPEQQLQEQ